MCPDKLTLNDNRLRLERMEAQLPFRRLSQAHLPAEPAPPQLKDTQLAPVGRINLFAVVVPQHLFAQFIDPQRRNSDGQQQAVQPLGIPQMRRIEIKTTGFVVAEALFDVHPP